MFSVDGNPPTTLCWNFKSASMHNTHTLSIPGQTPALMKPQTDHDSDAHVHHWESCEGRRCVSLGRSGPVEPGDISVTDDVPRSTFQKSWKSISSVQSRRGLQCGRLKRQLWPRWLANTSLRTRICLITEAQISLASYRVDRLA